MKIFLKKNEIHNIIINANYTTGCYWDFNKKQNIVTLKEKSIDNDNDIFVVGSPIKTELKITAQNKGAVVFNLARHWDKTNDDIEKTIEIIVD